MEKSLLGDLFINSPFWNSKLESLSHPVAIRMAQDLDPDGMLELAMEKSLFGKVLNTGLVAKIPTLIFCFASKNNIRKKLFSFKLASFMKLGALTQYF